MPREAADLTRTIANRIFNKVTIRQTLAHRAQSPSVFCPAAVARERCEVHPPVCGDYRLSTARRNTELLPSIQSADCLPGRLNGCLVQHTSEASGSVAASQGVEDDTESRYRAENGDRSDGSSLLVRREQQRHTGQRRAGKTKKRKILQDQPERGSSEPDEDHQQYNRHIPSHLLRRKGHIEDGATLPATITNQSLGYRLESMPIRHLNDNENDYYLQAFLKACRAR